MWDCDKPAGGQGPGGRKAAGDRKADDGELQKGEKNSNSQRRNREATEIRAKEGDGEGVVVVEEEGEDEGKTFWWCRSGWREKKEHRKGDASEKLAPRRFWSMTIQLRICSRISSWDPSLCVFSDGSLFTWDLLFCWGVFSFSAGCVEGGPETQRDRTAARKVQPAPRALSQLHESRGLLAACGCGLAPIAVSFYSRRPVLGRPLYTVRLVSNPS